MYNNLEKSGKFKSVVPKRKVANPPHRFDRHQVKIRLNLNFLAYSKSPCQWTGARMRVVKCVLGKSSCVSKIPPVLPTKQRITVSVFLSTLQLTALLLKSFHRRLHCYYRWRDMTHSCVRSDSLVCVAWLVHICSWVIYMWDMTHCVTMPPSVVY